jgi:hypothetical protein
VDKKEYGMKKEVRNIEVVMREGCGGHEVALPLSEAKRIAEAKAKPEASPTRSAARDTPLSNFI